MNATYNFSVFLFRSRLGRWTVDPKCSNTAQNTISVQVQENFCCSIFHGFGSCSLDHAGRIKRIESSETKQYRATLTTTTTTRLQNNNTNNNNNNIKTTSVGRDVVR